MTTAKMAVAAIIALSLGVAVGMFTAQAKYNAQIVQLGNELQQRTSQIDKLREISGSVDMLKRENERLRRENESLRETPAPVAAVAPPEGIAVPAPDLAMADAFAATPEDAATGASQDPAPGEQDPESAARRARRDQWQGDREQRAAEFRDRMQGFFDDAIQRAPDATAQNRIAAINEYTNYSMDLMRQMRDAQTDEERDAIRQELSANWDATRGLVREQQDYLLKESLKQSGVTDAKQQQTLIEGLRQTMEDPFFRMPGGGGPGGPGGPGGMPWGGGGRGGRGGDGGGNPGQR